ncbi:MAG: hypothetical protein KJ607_06290, partial [Bacteroidetes bacterium]|nr:hypothetical protein [Bacteroidota bacterium]
MKRKIYFTIGATLVFINFCFSQNYVTTDGAGDATDNYVTKWEDGDTYLIQNSVLYDDGTYVGLGTASPEVRLHLYGDSYEKSKLVIDRYGIYGYGPSVDLRGSEQSYDYSQNGVPIGSINWYGEDNSSFGRGAQIKAVTTGTWTGSSYPTQLVFSTVASGSTTLTARMT